MKKLFILLLSFISLTAVAQQKPKIAVYTTGEDPINEIVSNRLVDDFARGNEYTTVERTASFLAELSKEHAYERSGEVDDEQIAALGRQFNVQYVCVVSVLDVWNTEKYITARIIDTETAEVIASCSSNGSIQSSSELIGALNTLSESFFKAMRSSKQDNAKKVAVYVSKTGNRDVDIVLGDQLVSGFAKSGRYVAIERTNSFLKKLKDEQGYQQSGAVADDDLTRWGQQFGVQYVCIAKSTSWAGDYFITTRMLDVKTGEVVNSYKVEGRKLSNSRDVVRVAQEIAANLTRGTYAEQSEEELLAEQRIQEAKEEEEQARMRALISKSWDILLNERITDENHRGDDRCLIGNLYGKGIELFFNGNLHCGDYKGGDWVGRGIYICQDKTYVGEFKTAYSWGTGSLYDKNGKLIHYGKFVGIKPQKVLYREDGYNYTFGVINYKNGDKYVGELRNGIRHGKGLYIYAKGDGVAWYGEWKEGIRNGEGIFFYDGGAKYSTGIWKGDAQL